MLYSLSLGPPKVFVFFQGGHREGHALLTPFSRSFPLSLQAQSTDHAPETQRTMVRHVRRRSVGEARATEGNNAEIASQCRAAAHRFQLPLLSLPITLFHIFRKHLQEHKEHRSRPVRSTAGKVSRNGEKNKN